MESNELKRNFKSLTSIIEKNKLSKFQHEFGTDKGFTHSYIETFYQPYFDCVDNPKKILEIGTAGGASLALWKLAFPESDVIGCDINIDNLHPSCQLLLSSNELKLVKGDAYSKGIFETLGNNFDLIIDDGPHTLNSQISALNYIKKLSANGTLIIEDLGVTILTALRIKYSLPRKLRYRTRYLSFVAKSGKFDDAIFIYSKNKKVLNLIDKLNYNRSYDIRDIFRELTRVFIHKLNLKRII